MKHKEETMKIELNKDYRWADLPDDVRQMLIKNWSAIYPPDELSKRVWSFDNHDPQRWYSRKTKSWSKPLDPKYNSWTCSIGNPKLKF